MTETEIKRFARKHLERNGLSRWSVEFNTLPEGALARTSLTQGRVIELSVLCFIKHEADVKDEVLKDIILHEVGHALDFSLRGTSDHSRKWKRCARKVGADPTPTETRVPEPLLPDGDS